VIDAGGRSQVRVTPVHYLLCEPGLGEGDAERIRDVGSRGLPPLEPAAAAVAASPGDSTAGEAAADEAAASGAEVVRLPAPLPPPRLLPRFRARLIPSPAAAGSSCPSSPSAGVAPAGPSAATGLHDAGHGPSGPQPAGQADRGSRRIRRRRPSCAYRPGRPTCGAAGPWSRVPLTRQGPARMLFRVAWVPSRPWPAPGAEAMRRIPPAEARGPSGRPRQSKP
jgi:hypothetical protein